MPSASRRRAALRLGAATAGLLCVVAAVILMSSDGSRETPGTVNVAITNELGPQQLSEEISVFIDGRHVGVLKVDTRSPKARMVVAVSKVGRHAYTLVARRRAQGRSMVEVSSKGDVVIDGDSPLTFYSDPTGRTYLGR